MNIPRPTALYVSLTLIVTYWVYQVITAGAHAVLPADFSAFAGRIALIKLIHISAIFLLLRLERVGWRKWASPGVIGSGTCSAVCCMA